MDKRDKGLVPEPAQLKFLDFIFSLALIVPESRHFSISESRGSEARKYPKEIVQGGPGS